MEKFKNLSDINNVTREGRYLLAALAKITTESQTDKTPEQVLDQLFELHEKMYPDAVVILESESLPKKRSFEEELRGLLNSFSKENDSDTPDFILADHLVWCLATYNNTVNRREDFYGRKPKSKAVPTGMEG